MNTAQKQHLEALVREAARAEAHNDSAARKRARHEAVITWAYCGLKKWNQLVARVNG